MKINDTKELRETATRYAETKKVKQAWAGAETKVKQVWLEAQIPEPKSQLSRVTVGQTPETKPGNVDLSVTGPDGHTLTVSLDFHTRQSIAKELNDPPIGAPYRALSVFICNNQPDEQPE